jgi:hypothetical protein
MNIQMQQNRNIAQKLADAGQILQNAALDIMAQGIAENAGEDIKEVIVELETGKVKYVMELS